MTPNRRTDDPHPLIGRLRAMGMSDAVIFNRLLLEGWAEADVTSAFGYRIEPAVPPNSPATPAAAMPRISVPITRSAQSAPTSMRPTFPITTIALGALVVLALGVLLALYGKPPAVYSIAIAGQADASSTPTLSYGALPALSDAGYYGNVKETLIREKASFIDANLSSMQLTVFVGGALTLQVPILAKGRVGSWWETPAGMYKIETKEKMHFNIMEQVSMPYSLDFDGNFFIHGWPAYSDGTPVASTYSGGCIRLSTDDAQKVYDLARVGMPVLVYNERPAAQAFDYQLKAPKVSADEYLVADVKSGTVLTSKSASDPAPIASITKLVTALVASEYINLDKIITVPPEALVYTTTPRLKVGEKMRAYDLLFLLLQESSNEAAETLAATLGRDQFVAYMNAKAKAINLQHTTFNDPSGAESDFSTPEDLFTLLRYIGDNRRFVFEITTGNLTDSAYGASAFSNLNDFNVIKNAPADLIGGKIGQTNEAGETYAGVFSVDIGDQTRQIAVIILGSKDVQTDVRKLLQFVRASYAPAQ